MNPILAGIWPTMSETSWLVIVSAAIVIAVILFAKAIKLALKLVVIATMLLLIAYFLRQQGVF
jgi:hypothetical protein